MARDRDLYRYGTAVNGHSALRPCRGCREERYWADAGQPEMLEAITVKVLGWLRGDTVPGAEYEPSAPRLRSPAGQAELMAECWGRGVPRWAGFLLRPAAAASPPRCSHRRKFRPDRRENRAPERLHASRAWCWRRIAESLPAGDCGRSIRAGTHPAARGRVPAHVVGSHYRSSKGWQPTTSYCAAEAWYGEGCE